MEPTSGQDQPLSGLRVGITADRRGAELQSSLERLGATVMWGSTMRAVPPEIDELLIEETETVLAAAPEWFAVSTGSGLRAWLDTAERTGRRAEVEDYLRSTRVVARGAKSHGALRRIGAEPVFVSPEETMDDVCSWLAERIDPTERLGAQVHGGEVIGTLDLLRTRVRQVATVAPYRWALPEDVGPARRVVEEIAHGRIDLVAQTSAPSFRHLLTIADGMGLQQRVVAALRGPVVVAAVGPVTGRAFEEVGIGVDVMPERSRTADLLRAISQWALERSPRR